MARNARLWLDTPLEPPLHGSMGIMGHYVHRALGELGYDVECSVVPDQPPALQMMPLPAAESVAALRGLARDEIRVFFDRCLPQVAPTPSPGVTNIVFLHGLRYAPGIYLAGRDISGLCANSDYLRRVLLGLLLFPDLGAGARRGPGPRFAFRGDAVVGAVPLVLPAIDFPAGYPSLGDDLPRWAHEELEQDVWLGHALRPRKLIPEATAAVLLALNREPHRSRLGRPVRLFVNEGDRPRIVGAAKRLPGGDDVSPFVIPLPWIRNEHLVELMRRTHFALMVDWFPEPFGLYPLESVFHGAPVYTTGAGNLRHLLPPGHGIRVVEPGAAGAHAGAVDAFAACIADGLATGDGASACARGRDFIGRTYTAEAFTRGLGDFLDQVARAPDLDALDPDALAIETSPLVRAIDRDAGVLTSDLGEQTLDAGQLALMERAVGQRLAAFARDLGDEDAAALRSLFAAGAISLGSGAPSPCRIRLP